MSVSGKTAINTPTCKNPSCGKPVPHIPGHRRREYCNDTCKQTAYRIRKEHHGVTVVDESLQQRIAELEQELEQTRQGRDQVQQRLAEFTRMTNEKMGQLTGELARYRQVLNLDDRQKMNAEFMDTGQIIGWLALRSIDLNPGEYAWREYARRADDKQMAIALAGARNMYKVIKDLQTTEEVARLNNLVATLRQKLRECEKRKQS